MAANNIINWAWLIETGRIQEATADDDYIVVGSFDASGKTSSTNSRTREYLIKTSDFLAQAGGGPVTHPLKAGDTSSATWQSTLDYGGNNWTQITFATPFADNRYTPNVIATFKDPTILWTVAEVLSTGFRIVSNNPDSAPNDIVYWGTTKHGEY